MFFFVKSYVLLTHCILETDINTFDNRVTKLALNSSLHCATWKSSFQHTTTQYNIGLFQKLNKQLILIISRAV